MSNASTHDVLRDEPGATACLLGNVAVVRGALEAIGWLHGRPPGRYTIEQALGLGTG